ncbi:hypothetical protein DE146DRAFT_648090 [Phaeosphaeria sp. MPI-PUGE-AT-0046c]|nr:hypothetical protein DE146DRAFT_648090 [Phaeosphaeria sp. MPI-PUGE-AT-0046c]
MMKDDNYFGQVRHWLVTNISIEASGYLSISSGSEVSSYVPASPLPNYLYARPHRYVFIVARAPKSLEVTKADLRELQKLYVAAMAGCQEWQDIKDRRGFNAQKFIEMKGLKLEAATFVRVEGTVKSGMETTEMMAQGMANRACSVWQNMTIY